MRLLMVVTCVLSGCATARHETYAAKVHQSTVLRAESEHLSELGEAARESKPAKEPHQRRDHCANTKCSKCNSSPCTCDSSGSSFFGQIFGQAAFAVVAAPFAVPMTLLNDEYLENTRFPNFPYADDLPGSLVIKSEHAGPVRNWNGNLQVFAIPETDDMDRYGGRLVLDTDSRFGLDTETNYWRETGNSSSQAWTGDANLTFRFAESEHVQMRAGLGVNWLADHGGADAGLNFTYGLEWFPRKPFTIASVIDFGSIGRGTLFHNRTTAGVMLGPVEAFAGYDYFQIGSTNFHGPVAGLGLHF